MDWGAIWSGIKEGRQDRTYVFYVQSLVGNPTPQEMLNVDKQLSTKASACFSCDDKRVFQETDGSWEVRVFLADDAKIAQARAVLTDELGFQVLREGEFEQFQKQLD